MCVCADFLPEWLANNFRGTVDKENCPQTADLTLILHTRISPWFCCMEDLLHFLINLSHHSLRTQPKSKSWKPNQWLCFLDTGFCFFLTRMLIFLQFTNRTRTWCVSPGILPLGETEKKRKSESWTWLIKNAKRSSLSQDPPGYAITLEWQVHGLFWKIGESKGQEFSIWSSQDAEKQLRAEVVS